MRYTRYIPKQPDMSVNTEVKCTLAKLLATENLHVEHRKISTAYFDVDRRVLALPIWKDVTGDVYDLLVGHEVGHALYTPNEDYRDAPKDYVNVIEDARVERKMKVTYPGLRKSFFDGYQELNGKDFFEISKRDVSKMNLIDRINLHYKVGNLTAICFTDEEWVWVDRVANTVTFEDVVTLAEELYAYVQQKAEETPDLPPPPQSNNSGNSSEDKEFSPQSSDGQSESSDSDGDSDSDSGNSEDDLDDLSDPTGGDALDESVTERAWNQNQNLLVDDDAKEWVYLDLPKVDLDKIVVPYNVILHNMQEWFSGGTVDDEIRSYYVNSLEKTVGVYNQYKRDAQASVNYLVKQFEMKKSADEYARSSVSKTGVIDTNSLYKYKLTEDIFKRSTSNPVGKNHGLVFMLDWSGSMSNCLMDTIKQLYNLVWFCRKVQIPFEVYAFQSSINNRDGDSYGNNHKVAVNNLGLAKDFRLLQLFTSKMKKQQLDEQMKYIWAQCWGMASSYFVRHGYLREYSLGGTPLAEAVMCTRDIVKQFTKVNNVQRVNVVALTDGEANPLFYTKERLTTRYGEEYWHTNLLCHNLNKVFILRDPVTKYQRRIDPSPYMTTREIVSFYREITDYNWIGFRLCSKRDANGMISMFTENHSDYHTSWSKKRFVEIHNLCGFTVQYIMPNQNIGSGTADLNVTQKGEVATKAELTRAFRKHMGSKMTNKTILNKFVEMIA